MIAVIIDIDECLVSTGVDLDTATTLIALISEDPGCWDEATACWARYSSPAVCEFASSLPFSIVDLESAIDSVRKMDEWLVVDFRSKRILTGREFMTIGRDEAFAMVVDELGDQHSPVSVHLPPWWEFHEQVDANAIVELRQSPVDKPYVNRDVLFGEPFLMYLADRILSIVRSNAWSTSDAHLCEQTRYPFTLDVHREWLMTPRDDLGGRMPRQLLHGAHSWIDRVVWGQSRRCEDGAPMVAAPNDFDGYETAPMGSEEMVIYFDLCRELIEAGWIWCSENGKHQVLQNRATCQSVLVQFLQEARDQWLDSPFEGGSPPRFIIECSRRRVPRGAGVPIKGMTGQQSEQHLQDCDCPICNMMSDGMFGIGFVGLDGHHLDLDDDFAFSMVATYEDWVEMRLDHEEFSASFARNETSYSSESEMQPDEFAPVWAGNKSEDPLPGDSSGYLKLAFLLSEVVSSLQANDAPHPLIKQLNECFSEYRRSDSTQAAANAKQLKAALQTLGDEHPNLISKVADFQSRIDEQLRNRDFTN